MEPKPTVQVKHTLRDVWIIANSSQQVTASSTDLVLTVDEVLQTSATDRRYQHPDGFRYVLGSPELLSKLMRSQSSALLRHIRLCLLHRLSDVSLNELELNGGIDGPNVGPLVDSWRNAFRELPAQHGQVILV